MLTFEIVRNHMNVSNHAFFKHLKCCKISNTQQTNVIQKHRVTNCHVDPHNDTCFLFCKCFRNFTYLSTSTTNAHFDNTLSYNMFTRVLLNTLTKMVYMFHWNWNYFKMVHMLHPRILWIHSWNVHKPHNLCVNVCANYQIWEPIVGQLLDQIGCWTHAWMGVACHLHFVFLTTPGKSHGPTEPARSQKIKER